MGWLFHWLENRPFLHGLLLGLAFFLLVALLRHLVTCQ